MKVHHVGADHKEIIRGVVTSVTWKAGIVLLDDTRSAHFGMVDGCQVGTGDGFWSRFVKFTTSIDMKRPDPRGELHRRRIVVCLNRKNPNWAYLWAYESDYDKALDKLIEINEKLLAEAEEGERKRKNEERVRKAIDELGLFRIAQAHKFKEEDQRRPTRHSAGPMKLVDLLNAVYTHKVKFMSSEPSGLNATLFMWFERQTESGWTKVDFSGGEEIFLINAYNGDFSLEEIRPILDRLSAKQQEMAPA